MVRPEEELDVLLHWEGVADPESSAYFQELSEMIQSRVDKAPHLTTSKPPGQTMGVDLVTAVSFAQLAVATIGAIVAILAYRQQSKPRYSISVVRGNVTITRQNLLTENAESIAKRLLSQDASDTLRVNISLSEE